MQCGFGTSPGGNDETVCLVYSVESHVPEEDDARNVDIRNVSASNASEPSLQGWQELTRTAITQPNPGRRERLLSR